MIMVMVGLFYLAKGLFTILYWVAPILLVITLIINHKVVLNYGKWILNQFKNQNWPVAIGASALTVLAYPFVILFLFGKTMIMKKISESFPGATESMNQQTKKEDEFTDYEDITEESLELPELPKETQDKIDNNDYENLF